MPRLTYFDFSEHFQELYLIENTRQIDFSSREDRKHLLDGWSDTEPTHTWAINKAASIKFYTFQPERDLPVQIFCRAFDPIKDQKIKIYANEKPVGSLDISGGHDTFQFTVPAALLKKFENILTFVFKSCAKPSDFNINTDDRCLAVSFKKLIMGKDGTGRDNSIHLTNNGFISIPPNAAFRKLLFIESDSRLIVQTTPCDSAASGSKADGRFSISINGEGRENSVFSAAPHALPTKKKIDLTAFSSRFVDFSVKYTGNTDSGKTTVPVKWQGRIQTTDRSCRNRPNLLFIVIDTLRADYCGCLGALAKTPNIDRLAKNGVLFSQAFSHIPATLPSHTSMFSSLYPHETHVLNNGQHLSDHFRLSAEYLKGMRFFNSAAVSLGTLNLGMNINQGFDRYIDTRPFTIKQANQIDEELAGLTEELKSQASWNAFVHYSDPHEPYHGHDLRKIRVDVQLNGEGIAVFDLAKQSTYNLQAPLKPGKNLLTFKSASPFYLRQFKVSSGIEWEVRSGPKEGNYILNKARQGEILLQNDTNGSKKIMIQVFLSAYLKIDTVRESYKQEVEFADHYLGKALERFDSQGLLKNTLVILTSDHGEGIGDHNQIGHISQLYNSMIHVPLIVAAPGRLPAGKQIQARVRLIDVFPTVLDLFAARRPSHMRGESLLPLIEGKENTDRPVLGMTFKDEAPHNLVSLIQDDHKIIKNMNTGELELYQIKNDPGELENLITQNFIVSNRMEKALYDRLEDCGYPLETADEVRATGSTDPETLEMLRGLGYTK